MKIREHFHRKSYYSDKMAEDQSFTIAMNNDAPEGASLCGGFSDQNVKTSLPCRAS